MSSSRCLTIPCCVLFLSVLWVHDTCAQSNREPAKIIFSAGLKQAKVGNFKQALRLFLRAQAAGMDSPLLYFNTAVSHYQLKQPELAAQNFLRAAESRKLAALAYFNLAKISLDNGDRRQADKYFVLAEKTAQTEKMRLLSRSARDDNTPLPEDTTTKPGLVWLELGAGHDNNVLLSTDGIDIDEASNRDDELSSLMLYTQYEFADDEDSGMRVQYLAYGERYKELGEFDLNLQSAAFAYTFNSEQWQHETELAYQDLEFGENELTTTTSLDHIAQYALSSNYHLKLKLGYRSIDSSPEFDYLAGNSSEFASTISNVENDWELRYMFETNDRQDDLDEDGEFTSYSPREHTLRYKHEFLLNKFSLEIAGSVARSKYRGIDTRLSGLNLKRKDTLSNLSLTLTRDLKSDFSLGLTVEATKRNSNINEFDYDREAYMLFVQKFFRFGS